MKHKLFSLAQELIHIIQHHGHEAYLVGGAVRDTLLERPVEDIDIATSAFPEQIMQMFQKVIPTGIKHGTVVVRYRQVSFEITTFRTESNYSDYRRPDQVQFVSNLKEDLARRDFTINAIAMNESFRVIDPFQGKQDIKKKILRTVGNANQRFTEDPLRIMRAIRFQSQLNFEIEEQTRKAITVQAHLLKHIAMERIQHEWSKMLQGQAIKKALKTLRSTKVFPYLPVFAESKKACQQLEKVACPFENFPVFIVYMNWYVPEIDITTWIKNWKLSNQIKNDSKLLAELLKQYEIQPKEWVIYQLPEHLDTSFQHLLNLCAGNTITLQQIKKMKQLLPIKNRSELSVNGRDLIQLFSNREKGPWIRETLQAIEKAVVLGEVNNSKRAIREWLQDDRKK